MFQGVTLLHPCLDTHESLLDTVRGHIHSNVLHVMVHSNYVLCFLSGNCLGRPWLFLFFFALKLPHCASEISVPEAMLEVPLCLGGEKPLDTVGHRENPANVFSDLSQPSQKDPYAIHNAEVRGHNS